MNSWRNKINPFIVFLFIALSSCGYTTHSVLPGGESSIYIDNFVNKIDISQELSQRNVAYPYRPQMESDITREVIDRFILDGNYQIKDSKSAALSLKGELVDFKREPLRYDANDNVIEYRLSTVVNLTLYDLKEEKINWQ